MMPRTGSGRLWHSQCRVRRSYDGCARHRMSGVVVAEFFGDELFVPESTSVNDRHSCEKIFWYGNRTLNGE